MPITSYHCNGPALCYVSSYVGGVLQPFALLGYTDHGARLRVVENKSDIITDVFGPMTPQDIQDMGMIANISIPLIASDRAQLASLQGFGDRVATGLINTPGLVLGAAGYRIALAISASSLPGQADSPWLFPSCLVRPGYDTTLATRANPFTIEFFAFPWANYDTIVGSNTPLWSRTFTPP